MMPLFGYFDDPAQTEPAFDPGLDVDCLICHTKLSRPMLCVDLMLDDPNLGGRDSRSYFYRVHKECYESLTPEQVTDLDSVIIDAAARSKYSS